MHRRSLVALAAAVLGAGLVSQTAEAAKKKPRWPEVVKAVKPLGLQGLAGSGVRVGLIFTLLDGKKRPSDVEVQFGHDDNGDGLLTDDEFRPATEDRLDSRDTRRDRAPQLYPSSNVLGAPNQFVWDTGADVPSDSFRTTENLLTPQGRLIVDPENPTSYLSFPHSNGVVVRVRSVQRLPHHRRRLGAWVTTDAFSLDNDSPPSMFLNSVALAAPGSATVHVDWMAYDNDSEDFNGNGILDDDEDVNGNGLLDAELVGVAFDWHALAPGENPGAMTPQQLDGLSWSPCTRNVTDAAGQTDSLVLEFGQPPVGGLPSAPFPVGREWVFAWDSGKDVNAVNDGFILRAKPFDQKRRHGATVYWTTVIHPGQ